VSTFFQLLDLGLSSTPSVLLQQWLAFMQTTYPGYIPHSANLEYIQAVIFASWAADVNSQASQGASELFRQYGQQLIGLAPLQGSFATATVQVTAVDDLGHDVPISTQFILDGQMGFLSTFDVEIPEGSTTADVQLVASEIGTDGNGLGSLQVQFNQQLNWVSQVTIVSESNGGVDPETPDQYLSRLSQALQLLAPRPITTSDYSIFVQNFAPAPGTDQQEVGRATSIDGYNPADGTFNNERMVTVSITDINGFALNDDTIAAVQAFLESAREVNFIVNVVSPTYSPVYVIASVQRQPSFPVSVVQAGISQALQALLSPANWGFGQTATWSNTTTVYQSVVEAAIQNTPGVQNIVTGTLGLGFTSAANDTGDLVLPGVIALPTTSNGATVPPTNFTVVN
jgi:hypothetical protein